MMEASNQAREETGLCTLHGHWVPLKVHAAKHTVRLDKLGPVEVPFFDDSAIDYIAATIRERIKDGFDSIVMITGARRTGKSTLGLQIARKVSPSFDLDSIAFRVEDFSEVLNKNPYADPSHDVWPQAFLDEAGHGLYSKEWMSLWQRNLVKCLEVIGMKKQVCYFILPHMQKLTGDVRDEMAHIWIDVDTWGFKRGYAEVYMGTRNKFKQSIFWQCEAVFKFDELKGEFWTKYEDKKRLFIDEIAAEKIATVKVSKDTERLNKLIADVYRRGISAPEIAEKIGVTDQTIYDRLNLLKNEQK